jgi:hypothetical protein
MKKLITIIAAATALGFTAPATAEAHWGFGGQQRIVSHTRCGQPVLAFYQVLGFDHCGNPVGRWVTQPVNCGCHVCRPNTFWRPVPRHPNVCPPPVFHRGSVHGLRFRR